MLPFKIDLSRLSYAVAVDVIAPFIPGGIVVTGWLLRHREAWAHLHEDAALKIAMVVFLTYVVGFAIHFLTQLLLSASFYYRVERIAVAPDPWRDEEWRKLASAFLGPELSPHIEKPAEQTPVFPSEITPEAVAKYSGQVAGSKTAHWERSWQIWYEILRARFPVKHSQNNQITWGYLLTFHSMGWAGLA